jgi:hypothetical protein
MKALSSQELLAVWEQSDSQRPTRRGLALLAAAEPETPIETLASLSIGERDRRLLALREWAFGSRLASRTTCPQCSEEVELDLAVSDIRSQSPQRQAPLTLQAEGYEITFRLINSADLELLREGMELPQATRMLIERCVLKVIHNGMPSCPNDIPEHILDRLDKQLEEADADANIQLHLRCPACGHGWAELFDVVQFFWREIQVWALRLFQDIHTLASAYGWREADILAMSPLRRRLYLGMQA